MVEGINGAGMTYQGSTSASQKSIETTQKVNVSTNEKVANEIAKNTTKISAKETSREEDNQDNNSAQEQQNSQIRKAVEDINKKAMNTEAIFGIHDATNRVTIKIVDKTTRDVIKEIPPEKTLDMIAKAWELAGLMVDERR